MHTRSLLWSAAFGIMVLASAFLLFADDPEQVATGSPDGVVTVTGVARDTAPFTVATGTSMTGGVMFGTSYDVTPSLAPLDEPVVLTFALAGVPVPPGDVVVYRYDPDLLMWEMALPIVAHTDGLIAIETTTLGTFALGVREQVTLPNFVEVYDDLAKHPVTDAVGYVIVTGYARPDEPIIRLGAGDQGGCGGAVMPGVREERSVTTRDVSLLVDDVDTPLTLTFLVRWFIHDGVGCPAGTPFQAADEYGILPAS